LPQCFFLPDRPATVGAGVGLSWGYAPLEEADMSPKINVYLPDELAGEVKASGIPVSAVGQQALADAVARARTGLPAPVGLGTGDDVARSFTKRAYAVVADAEKAAERDGDKATTVHLVAAVVESNGLAVTVLSAADIDPEDVVDELRARAKDGGRPDALETV